MKQIKNRVILIILFLQFGPIQGATFESNGHTNRRIMERLSFGKMWYVYIKANIFDIVVHTFRMRTEDSNATSMSLHGAVKQMGRFKILRYPCQSLNISFNGSIFHDAIHKKGLSQLELGLTKSKICGSISRSFGFIAPSMIAQERNDKDLTWLWQIHVNQQFIVNVTFLSLESRFYPLCITRRALIQETGGIDLSQKRILGVFCPNNPPQSFYSSGNNVEINVHTWHIYAAFFSQNVYFNQWIGTVSFTYEILDNDLSLDPWKLLERGPLLSRSRKVLERRWESGKDEYYHFAELAHLYSRKLPPFHVAESLNNETNEYLFQLLESNGEIVFVFYFKSYIGRTIAVREGLLTCTKTQANLVAYEGPMVDMARIESLLVRLQEWNCGHYMNATNPEEELKGRIGDMTILFLVKKRSRFHFYSLTLQVAYRAIERNTRFALRQNLYLETDSSISFEQNGTYFYSIIIQSAKNGFVNIYFDHISLRGYMDQTCTYGGLYFGHHADVYNYYTTFVGAICSQKSVTRFQRLYGRHGLTFNYLVGVFIKQYYLLFQAHVKLRFSLDQCLGFHNLHVSSSPRNYIPDEKEYLDFIRDYRAFYGYGLNFYYRWPVGNLSFDARKLFVGIKRRNGTSCYKANYVNFDTIDYMDAALGRVKAVVGTERVENVRPSRMSMAFWNMDEELKHFDKCLGNAFRFFPDNQNNEPYVLIRAPEEDLWVTLAFTGKFALDKTCLIFGGAFQFRVQETDGYSQCFSEVGGYLYDDEHPILPKGVCGKIVAKFWYHEESFERNIVSFQRPLIHAKCCHLNMLVISKSIPCIKHVRGNRMTILQTGEYMIGDIYEWFNQINTNSEMVTWRALCTKNIAYYTLFLPGEGFIQYCLLLGFQVFEACDVNIHYHMSLLPPVHKDYTRDSIYATWVCHGNSCYSEIVEYFAMSWDDAQAICIKRHANLVSVNSDAEWRYLIHNFILQRKAYVKVIYIGYRTVSNPFHNDCTLNSRNFLLSSFKAS